MTRSTAGHPGTRALLIALIGLVGLLVSASIALAMVLLSVTDASNSSAAGYLPLAWSALAVLLTVLAASALIRRIDVRVIRGFPWIVGLVSFVASFVPWLAVSGANPDLGALVYRGLKVPQGIMQFWDLDLVMLSVDCARWGFDIYMDNNGCMQDASIYAPGMVWVQYTPFDLFSRANVPVLGLGIMLISSLVLAWLARQSAGIGQIALLVAALGGPWLLLLERANIDAVVLWTAAATMLLTRRWSGVRASSPLWPWIVAAALLWLMGTWKYYPFALGIMLLPVLRIRHGWTVLVGFAAAATAFVLVTWENFRFSSSSNSAMIDYGDFVVLGRVPVVARMLGTQVGMSGWQLGDVLLGLVVVFAGVWGIGIGLTLKKAHVWTSMLGGAGSAVYLASVLVAGFGWGYKAVFLLLALPLLSQLVSNRQRLITASALAALLLVGVQSVVVWNTVMATMAGLVAAGFVGGLSVTLLLRAVVRRQHPAPAIV